MSPVALRECEMDLKRSAKILALKTIAQSGSSPTITGPTLKVLGLGYGPISPTEPGKRRPPAAACISVDFDVTDPSRYDNNRKGTIALSELASRYRIPITWAVCGKSAEADMRSYSAIVDSSSENEIGVHTYSHIDASVASADQFRTDIERCIQVLGLDSPRTFVFPWNREAHFGVLRSLGFKVFRGKQRAIGNPVLKEGIWNVRPVYYVDQKSKGAESLMKKYVDLCENLSTPFHLWTHPWSLVIEGRTEPMIDTLESLFAYIAAKREAKSLRTSTLGGIATFLEGEAGARQVGQGPEVIPASWVPS
jgi:Polysaccharide deacetylase